MANQEDLTLLRQGTETWNHWRMEYPNIQPDLLAARLSGVDFSGVDFSGANLRETDLRNADLFQADLRNADLRDADLSGARLSWADLSGARLNRADLNGADLSGADLLATNLSGANLSGADLRRADLNGANLSGARLNRADLNGANLNGARLHSTLFAKNNLTIIKGLDTIIHDGPSSIDFETVILPPPGLTLSTFLRGIGSSPYISEALSGTGTVLPLEPVPVKIFMSYAHPDEEFCKHLQAHLSLLIHEKIITLTSKAVLGPEIEHWEATPNTAFQEAQILLLLVSAPFLASHHAWEDIIEPALFYRQYNSIYLIPIILCPTVWQESSLAAFQALPLDGKPVTEWGDIHAAFTDIVKNISNIARPLHTQLQKHAKKRRRRDLLTAKIILNTAKTAQKQDQAEKQNELVQQAENAYKAAQANFTKVQQRAETLQADLISLASEHNTLHDQIDALNAQIQEESPIPP